jgi:hypothetical protein
MMKSLLLFLFAIEIKAKIVAKYLSVTLVQFISFAYLCIKVKILNISKLRRRSEAIKNVLKNVSYYLERNVCNATMEGNEKSLNL